jgi:membrane-bound lytic murein transglycosylase D
LLLAGIGIMSVACATSKTTPAAVPAPTVSAPSAAQVDSEEFRRELEDAYARILDRQGTPTAEDVPTVDLEAAASITIPRHRTIDSAVRLFSVDMKDSIQASLIRSGRYRAMIDKALEAERLPKALAYLPVIESAYLPTLTSRAGAYGIWQFMPATAREYGLRVDWWLDERADPELSTRAAAAYLRDLHRMFGDWALALAAYNCGPGRVRRTLTEAGATTFWELLDRGLLPKETRGYVPTFFATIIIASDPGAYGFTLGRIADHDQGTVEVRGPLSLDWIAEVTGADAELLRELNPALRRGVVPPGRGSVRVPRNAVPLLAERADTLHRDDENVKFCAFTLRRGDNIDRIARAIGVKRDTILAMNDLSGGSRPRTGDTIYLPVRARELGTLLAHSEDEDVIYAVRKGDTLYSIAKKNGLSVAELRDLNDLRKDQVLRVGQKLRISAPKTLTAGGM